MWAHYGILPAQSQSANSCNKCGKTLKKHTTPERSGPIYISTRKGIISLVEEARLTEIEFSGVKLVRVRPNALFIIDEEGVRRVRVAPAGKRQLALALVAVLCAPLQYWLLARRARRGR